MKQINPKILLTAVGLIIIAAAAAYYGGVTLAVTEGYVYFHADDGDRDPMPEKTRFDFFENDGGEWKSGGSYTIDAYSQEGMRLWLRSDTQYKAVPVWYDAAGWASPDDWILPSEEIFYGGGLSTDITFAYEEIICTPNTDECEGDVLYSCNSDGTKLTSTTCAYGCSDGACIEPPSVPCIGLPECSSSTGSFQECCENKVWDCMWSNYDGAGYRMQWQPEYSWTCDADCVCDGATTGQDCWCADLTPDCSGLGVCSHGIYLCEACCEGDVWECRGHYKWEMKESCMEDETCDCYGDTECLDCDCKTIATPTPTPTPSPANIDDNTDTLTFDKTSYQLGETVNMYATGTNIGGETWSGKVSFTITQPDGTINEVTEQWGVSVIAGGSKTVTDNFQLPTTGQSGTWTAQSRWITDAGVIDAKSSILGLGEDEAEDNTIWIIGGIAAFLLLLYFAFRKTKR
jgi:hypothetical protein